MSTLSILTSAVLAALVVSFAGAALLAGACTFDQFLYVSAPFAGGTALAHVAQTIRGAGPGAG